MPGLASLDVVWLFSRKVSGNLAAVNILTTKGTYCSTAPEVNDQFAANQNDISVELQSRYESNTTYVDVSKSYTQGSRTQFCSQDKFG